MSPFFWCALPALHRWIAVATADLLSEIRNGGGNDPEPSRSGSVGGALEGHLLKAPVWDGVFGNFNQKNTFLLISIPANVRVRPIFF